MCKKLFAFIFLCLIFTVGFAEDGYNLWLNFKPLPDAHQKQIQSKIRSLYFAGTSPTMKIVRNEFVHDLGKMLEKPIPLTDEIKEGSLIAGKAENLSLPENQSILDKVNDLNKEGFFISSETLQGKNVIIITGKTDKAVLYGTYYFLQLIQTGEKIENLNITNSPKIKIRILNHWDNLDRSVERGYAGQSLWNWETLPDKIDPRYIDYARANASIGINGCALNNVNANPSMLQPEYLKKVAALADVFRPYGIKIYLSVKFSSPQNIGGLTTSDPIDPNVQEWWKNKVKEIYSYIPDFGGFLVKANSEGQPGPQNYNRTHAEGANMLADALNPFGGIVMWRAFVYDNNVPEDRAKQALNEFQPLDGEFRNNILIQVKNGPVDFQPREPFHPMFGKMPLTPLMMEFQITQEYLGQSTDLCYLAPLYKECLNADTYAKGKGSTVAKVIDGSLENHKLTGIAGVANTGTDRNWTGHLFGQANWFAFGKLAWNHKLTSENIAEQWIKLTFSTNPEVVAIIKKIMMDSHENSVNYMTPLGLHHIMGQGHHFGPGPWVNRGRADWTSVYYHRADSNGIGFNRTPSGSNATSQYFKPVADKFANSETCPDEYLLWFHHLPWNYKMRSGKTLWEELCYHYYDGVNGVKNMQQKWNSLEGKIDQEKFEQVNKKLAEQIQLAKWWQSSCVLYFQQFSKMPIPARLEKPKHPLEYFQKMSPQNFMEE